MVAKLLLGIYVAARGNVLSILFIYALTLHDDSLLLGGVVKVSHEVGHVVVVIVVPALVVLGLAVVVVGRGRRGARHVRGELLQVGQRLGAELVEDSCIE